MNPKNEILNSITRNGKRKHFNTIPLYWFEGRLVHTTPLCNRILLPSPHLHKQTWRHHPPLAIQSPIHTNSLHHSNTIPILTIHPTVVSKPNPFNPTISPFILYLYPIPSLLVPLPIKTTHLFQTPTYPSISKYSLFCLSCSQIASSSVSQSSNVNRLVFTIDSIMENGEGEMGAWEHIIFRRVKFQPHIR